MSITAESGLGTATFPFPFPFAIALLLASDPAEKLTVGTVVGLGLGTGTLWGVGATMPPGRDLRRCWIVATGNLDLRGRDDMR